MAKNVSSDNFNSYLSDISLLLMSDFKKSEIAKEEGMTLQELNDYIKENIKISDEELEKYKNMLNKKDGQ